MASNGTFGRSADQNRTTTYGSASRKQQGRSSETKGGLLAKRTISGSLIPPVRTPNTHGGSNNATLQRQTAAQSPEHPELDPYAFEPVSPTDGANDGIRKRKHSSAFSISNHRSKSKPMSEKPRDATTTQLQDGNGDDAHSMRNNKDKLGRIAARNMSTQPPMKASQSHPGRRRLIDTLAAQRPKTPDSESDDDGESTRSGTAIESDTTKAPRSSSPRLPLAHSQTPERRVTFAKNKKIKMTYSQSRTTIASRPRGDDLAPPDKLVDGTSALSDVDAFSAPPSPSAWDNDEEDDDISPKVGIRSVHELRRAGANNRFSDEMDDILARVSTPASQPSAMRRNALCEVAQKLRRQDFVGQFRDHAARDKIVKNIQEEHDPISGFALIAALVIFLSAGPAPHLLRQLASEKIGILLSRLLSLSDDIVDIASRKETNVPKATKSSLGSIKTLLLEMPLWHDWSLDELSPRTLSLQLLDILGRCSEPRQLDEICHDTAAAMDVVSDFQAQRGPDGNTDYVLTVFALEAQSILIPIRDGAQSHSASRFLERTLQKWPRQQQSSLDRTTLKLAINMTNNEKSAAAFNQASTILLLAKSISIGFTTVKEAVDSQQFQTEVYDELLLLLGILINLLEHCPAIRNTVQGQSIRNLAAVWISNIASVNEVSSLIRTFHSSKF